MVVEPTHLPLHTGAAASGRKGGSTGRRAQGGDASRAAKTAERDPEPRTPLGPSFPTRRPSSEPKAERDASRVRSSGGYIGGGGGGSLDF